VAHKSVKQQVQQPRTRVVAFKIEIGKATSPATANVIAQETRFHAFLDALKQNAILFARHFDMSLQRRLGISWSSVRPNFQNVSLARPRTRKAGINP